MRYQIVLVPTYPWCQIVLGAKVSYNPRAQSKGSAWGSVRGFVRGSVWGSIRPAGLEGPQDFYLSYFGRLIQSVWNCPGNQDVCKRGIGWKGIGLRRGRLLRGGMVLERLFRMRLCPSLAERHLHCWSRCFKWTVMAAISVHSHKTVLLCQYLLGLHF